MKPYAILFTKKPKGKKAEPTMVILATAEKIHAYGMPGIGKAIVDGMNEEFARLDKAGVKRVAKELLNTYPSGGTGYGSSIAFLDYVENKSTIESAIRKLTSQRVDAVIGKAP